MINIRGVYNAQGLLLEIVSISVVKSYNKMPFLISLWKLKCINNVAINILIQ